jgi:hypothetical protein
MLMQPTLPLLLPLPLAKAARLTRLPRQKSSRLMQVL